MRRRLTRRDFLKGSLAALGMGLASCTGPQRLSDVTPLESQREGDSTPYPPTLTERPELYTEAPPTATIEGTDTPELHEAMFYQQLGEETVQCQVCFRSCTVPEGGTGFCRNKVNIEGRYYTKVYGHPSALQIDPVEKEPHFHMLPGSLIFCTGTASCNNRCKFCQNWHLSQKSFEEIDHIPMSPQQTVEMAIGMGCHSVSFTYNEPTVFYEHMLDVSRIAKDEGLGTLFHTNGGMREEPLSALLEYMDAVTVDLKAFTPEFYREVSSSQLEPVLRTLHQIHQSDAHLEIVNLVVTTLNDDMDDIRRMCQWIRDSLSDEIPLHFTRFFPAYKLTSLPPTPIETLESAAQIADEEGLKYVYIGNVPGHVRNSTFCPECGKKIIERVHFSVTSLDIVEGQCRFCGYDIPGIWWDI
ncbi:MAG: AmmeMemoRadiSam system radical SAM enzyme [Anaerolineaceae bacterium]|nr:MAG: AmmeMemoRadiSam system radical SAM enzyme [Anaerolineaceae bacterium]